MIRYVVRALLFGALGAALSVGALAVSFAWNPAVALEMDRDLPRSIAHGFYPAERTAQETFAWTGGRAGLRLQGLDRRVPWTCELRFRGARPDPATLPDVTVDVDGVTTATARATNEFADLRIDAPPRREQGLTLTIALSNTFVPGPGDKRALGIQVDHWRCAPADGTLRPPTRAWMHAAGGGAAFGMAAGLAGVPLLVGGALGGLVATGQAAALTSGPAAYGAYPEHLLSLAFWITVCALVVIVALQSRRRVPLSTLAVAVVLLSAAALYLKLLGLLHPMKFVIDAVFHAHRLEWVLGGRYFFTQGMPGGVSFPYAIGLYIFAAPWTLVTTDYVTLLRIVVSSAEVVAGGLLYVLVVKTWRDSLAGAAAVLLYHLVPVPFEIVGNANMTNAFGQATALAALVAIALCPSRGRPLVSWAGAFVVCAAAFLSHISTFTQLFFTLFALGVLYFWRGSGELRRPGLAVVLGAVAAAILAVVVYYGQFMDVYTTAWHARAQAIVPQAPPVDSAAAAEAATGGGAPFHVRLANALRLTATGVGWPILILAAVGGWRLWVRGARDRLALVVLALLATYVAFLLASTFSRVDRPFERYAAEFVGRVVLATYPAAALLGGIAAAWGWRAGLVPRVASVLIVCWALAVGFSRWAQWFS